MNIISHISQTSQQAWETPLSAQYGSWHYEVREDTWNSFSEIQDRYPDAECYKPNKVIFHVLKGKAVIYAHVEYAIGYVYVRFVGSKNDFFNYLKEEAA